MGFQLTKVGNYRICVSLAGVSALVTAIYPSTVEFLREYETDEAPVIEVAVTGGEIEREREASMPDIYPDEYLETLAVYRIFCEKAAERDVILFHSSAVAVDGAAYLFTAPSGTGKSTHARLWRELLGERAVMLNDDKPLLRFSRGEIRAYGTPWNGKHRLGAKISAPVRAICFISRAKENSIVTLSAEDALARLLSQTYRPADRAAMARILPLAVRLANEVPLFELFCNMEPGAAELSYRTLSAGGKKEI